jgi:hypothetical protein
VLFKSFVWRFGRYEDKEEKQAIGYAMEFVKKS